jgi:hypothetical protein
MPQKCGVPFLASREAIAGFLSAPSQQAIETTELY